MSEIESLVLHGLLPVVSGNVCTRLQDTGTWQCLNWAPIITHKILYRIADIPGMLIFYKVHCAGLDEGFRRGGGAGDRFGHC